jgi:hypothetical protein
MKHLAPPPRRSAVGLSPALHTAGDLSKDVVHHPVQLSDREEIVDVSTGVLLEVLWLVLSAEREAPEGDREATSSRRSATTTPSRKRGSLTCSSPVAETPTTTSHPTKLDYERMVSLTTHLVGLTSSLSHATASLAYVPGGTDDLATVRSLTSIARLISADVPDANDALVLLGDMRAKLDGASPLDSRDRATIQMLVAQLEAVLA